MMELKKILNLSKKKWLIILSNIDNYGLTDRARVIEPSPPIITNL